MPGPHVIHARPVTRRPGWSRLASTVIATSGASSGPAIGAAPIRRARRCDPPSASGAAEAGQLGMRQAFVARRHRVCGEALHDTASACATIDFMQAADGLDQLVGAVADETRDAIGHDLRHRAAGGRQDRGPARHGLDHHHAERLRPCDRKEQGAGPRQQVVLRRRVELAQPHDLGPEGGGDVPLEVLVLGGLAALGADAAAAAPPLGRCEWRPPGPSRATSGRGTPDSRRSAPGTAPNRGPAHWGRPPRREATGRSRAAPR